MIQNASQSMQEFSSDNFSLTFYDTMIEFVRVIFVKPDLIKKIDKDFVYSIGDEFGLESVASIKTCSEQIYQPANVGTMTKFFFYTLETICCHFVPFVKDLMDTHQRF